MNVVNYFKMLVSDVKSGKAQSVCSICSANRYVIEAAIESAILEGKPVLIEATANQINQFGGYTGMQPKDFADYIHTIADKLGFDHEMLILGGDHLGPLVWSNEAEKEAMDKAETLVSSFAEAGFRKIHIDCSMHLGDDDPSAPLPVSVVAQRSARLVKAAEAAASERPIYVIGSEVPIPGGATNSEDELTVTSTANLKLEYDAFRDCFVANGLEDAFERVVGIVVQPGVEFSDNHVFLYDQIKAAELVAAAKKYPSIVLEGHSTDYQPQACLQAMCADGIAIQKVGPALTFAVREALFALENIERTVYHQPPARGYSDFAATLERVMLDNPKHWEKHYRGDRQKTHMMRKFSLSDRSRYYLDNVEVEDAISLLLENIDSAEVPFGLLHQYMPRQAEAVISGKLPMRAEALLKYNISNVLRTYK